MNGSGMLTWAAAAVSTANSTTEATRIAAPILAPDTVFVSSVPGTSVEFCIARDCTMKRDC